MIPEQINIAIAEACGWRSVKQLPDGQVFGMQDVSGGSEQAWVLKRVPNYHGSLDAMHEAEKVLNAKQCANFAFILCNDVLDVWLGDDTNEWFEFAHATAAQRAEAFLRTLGKWRG